MLRNPRVHRTAKNCVQAAFAYIQNVIPSFILRRPIAVSLVILCVVSAVMSGVIRRARAAALPTSNVISLVSVNSAGTNSGNNTSSNAVVSANGRFIAFTSVASNLSGSIDQNNQSDVFVRDLLNNTTELISRKNSSNFAANGPSGSLTFDSSLGISADGTLHRLFQ